MKRVSHCVVQVMVAALSAVLLASCGGGSGGAAATDAASAGGFGGIAGVVLTASGHPQSAVHVRAVAVDDPLVQVGRFTDSDGVYRIDGLPAGDYQILVENIDGRGSPAVTRNRISNSLIAATPQFPDEYYSGGAEDGADDPAASTPVTVSADQVADGINFILNDSGTPGNHVLPGADDITSISIGDTVSGTLGEPGDFTDDVGLGVFVDYYAFVGTAGGRVTISAGSAAFDTVLMVWGPNGFSAVDDDSGPATDSVLMITLPEVGTYVIGVTSYASDQQGDYTLSLQQTVPDTTPVIAFGTTVSGMLESTDTVTSGFYEDTYKFDAAAGTAYTLTLASAEFDTYLILISPTNQPDFNDDAAPPATDSRLSGALTETGTWYVIVSSFSPGATGAYQLTLTSP